MVNLGEIEAPGSLVTGNDEASIFLCCPLFGRAGGWWRAATHFGETWRVRAFASRPACPTSFGLGGHPRIWTSVQLAPRGAGHSRRRAELRSRLSDRDGEPRLLPDHRQRERAVSEQPREELRPGDQLQGRHPSQPAELHRDGRRFDARHNGRLRRHQWLQRPGANQRPAYRRCPGQRRQDVEVVPGIDAGAGDRVSRIVHQRELCA